jgi:hypothetical protein
MKISTGREHWIFLTTSWKSVISPGCRCRDARVAEFLLGTDVASRVGPAQNLQVSARCSQTFGYLASAKESIQFGTSRAYFLPNMSF